MRIVAINGVEDGRPVKWVEFDAREDAEVFAAKHSGEVVDTSANPSHLRKIDGVWTVDPRPAPRQAIIDYDAFRARFTNAERTALVKYLRGVDANGDPRNPLMLEAHEAMVARNAVNLDSAETISLFDQLVADGIFTAARRAEILAQEN